MAILYYQPKADQIDIFEDPTTFQKADLQERYDTLRTISDFPAPLRAWIALDGLPAAGIPGDFANLADFDAWLADRFGIIADALDYFDYETRIEGIEVADGAWFTPEALESVNDAAPGQPGENAIDGNTDSFWASEFVGTREITFRLRDHLKTVQGFRVWAGDPVDARAQLQNVVVRAAEDLGDIGAPSSIIQTGLDFTFSGDPWIEVALTTAVRTRFLRLDLTTALALPPSELRIYEFQVRVGTTDHSAVV